MKSKVIYIVLILTIALFCTVGCQTNVVKIEEYEWELVRVLVLENESVKIMASNEENDILDGAERVGITLKAENGKITITDHINDRTYLGTYERTQTTPQSTDYTLIFDGQKGHATVAMTTYADGTQTPTLPISLGDYTLQFYAK